MRTHLFIACFWLLAAVFCFLHPAARDYRIFDTQWSVGWLLLFFSAWHVLRWRLARARGNSEAHTPESSSGPQSP